MSVKVDHVNELTVATCVTVKSTDRYLDVIRLALVCTWLLVDQLDVHREQWLLSWLHTMPVFVCVAGL